MPIDNLDNVPDPPWSDAYGHRLSDAGMLPILRGEVASLEGALAAQKARAERLRLKLEKIGWMDEFLNADGAKAMMNIARDAVQADEDSGG